MLKNLIFLQIFPDLTRNFTHNLFKNMPLKNNILFSLIARKIENLSHEYAVWIEGELWDINFFE